LYKYLLNRHAQVRAILDDEIIEMYNPSHAGVVSAVVEYAEGVYRDQSDLTEKEIGSRPMLEVSTGKQR